MARYGLLLLPRHRKGRVNREIFRLAFPAMGEQILVQFITIFSLIQVGHLGKEAMAAVGFINSFLIFMQAVFSGFSTGATVVIARMNGERDYGGMNRALKQAIALSILLAAVLLLLCYPFATPIIGFFFKAEGETFSIAVSYFKLILLSMPFFVLDMMVGGAMRGSGDTKTPMYTTFAADLVYLAVGIPLIYGVTVHGVAWAPKLGVTGVGIAMFFTRMTSFLLKMAVLYSPKRKGHLRMKWGEKFHFDFPLIQRISKIGFPAFFEQVIFQGGFLMMQTLISGLGTVSIAAYQVGNSMQSVLQLPSQGIGNSCTALVGKALGEKKRKKARCFSYGCLDWGTLIITVAGVVISLSAGWFAGLYTNDQEVIREGIPVILAFAMLTPFMAIIISESATLRSAGDILFVLIPALVGLWLSRVGLSWVLINRFQLGLAGVMIGTGVDLVVRAMLYLWRVRKGKWEQLRV